MQLPGDVLAEANSQIVDAIATGGNLCFAVFSEDILKGPLKAVEEALVSTVAADHPSIQKICQQGMKALPFEAVPYKSWVDEQVKKWAQNLFSNQA